MTYAELKNSPKDVLTPADVAEVLGCNPVHLRLLIRDDPESLPFPVFRAGSWGKIPKAGFCAWFEGVNVAAVVRETVKEIMKDECTMQKLFDTAAGLPRGLQ